MEPGEVYIADFPEAGPHPVIVVSREALNRGHYALVAGLYVLSIRCPQPASKLRSLPGGRVWLHGQLRSSVRKPPLDRQETARYECWSDRRAR